MNTLMIREFGDFRIPDSNCFDLTKTNIADCIGCWTCWWKTPGICIHEDLADFYRSYINADKVIIFAKLENGFVSSKLKTLLDCMIPLFLPYTIFEKGGTWHVPRYPKYPAIEFYFNYEFEEEADAHILHDYIHKVIEQFHSKEICIGHVSQFQEASL